MRAASLLAPMLVALIAMACGAPAPTAPASTAAPPTEHPATATPTQSASVDPNATPTPTPLDLLPLLTAGITVYNLGDTPLFVSATLLDPDSTDEVSVGSVEIAPLQFTRQAALPVRYRIGFSYSAASPGAVGTCTIDVAETDEVDFVAVAGGVVVTRNAVKPTDRAEMVVATSSLCRAGATQ